MKSVSAITIAVTCGVFALGASVSAYEGVDVSNGGTVKGQVKYAGSPPTR